MRYTANINLPIVEDNDLYSKEINNLAFEKIDEEIKGLADAIDTLDSPENSLIDIKENIKEINELLYKKISSAEWKKHNISNLKNVLGKLARGENVLIHCVGDSTTYGTNSDNKNGINNENTYVGYLSHLLSEKYTDYTVERWDGTYSDSLGEIDKFTKTVVKTTSSNSKIVITRNGIGGNTLLRIFNRLNNYTGYFKLSDEWLEPDLIIYMGGINDSLSSNTRRYIPPNDFKQGLSTFVNTIRELNEKTDIVLMTPNWGELGTLTDYQNAIRDVALSEGTGFVDIHGLWLEHYNSNAENWGQGDWLSVDMWHPTSTGHKANAIYCFNSIFNNDYKTISNRNSVTNLNYKIDYNDDNVLYSGIWGENIINYVNFTHKEKWTNTSNSTITINLKCKKLYLICRKSNGAVIDVTIGNNTKRYEIKRNYPKDRGDFVGEQATFPNEKVLIGDNLSNNSTTITIKHISGYFVFNGFWVECDIDNREIVDKINNNIINKKILTINMGNKATCSHVEIFARQHKTMPIISVLLSNINVLYGFDSTSTNTNQVKLWFRKLDGSNFNNETMIAHLLSYDS